MRTKIVRQHRGLNRQELMYETFNGDMKTCPVCGGYLGLDEDCLTCEFAYREALKEQPVTEVKGAV